MPCARHAAARVSRWTARTVKVVIASVLPERVLYQQPGPRRAMLDWPTFDGTGETAASDEVTETAARAAASS